MSKYDKFRDEYGDRFVEECEDVDRILGALAEDAYIGPSNCSVKAARGYVFILSQDRPREVFEALDQVGKQVVMKAEGEVYVTGYGLPVGDIDDQTTDSMTFLAQ